MKEYLQHIFLIGAKSLGAYGGYETFINKLTEYHRNNSDIKYHVACKANGSGSMDPRKIGEAEIISDTEFIYHNANCFRISVPEGFGSAQAIYYDCAALKKTCDIIRKDKIQHPVVYIMACRVGPFIMRYYNEIHRLGGKVYLNPDGHEWLRSKWSAPVRKYWKISEQIMVKYSDKVICDSINIEKYIHECYDGKGLRGRDPDTTFIAYGAETRKSALADDAPSFLKWMQDKNISPDKYFLVVGRFVPENNYETMIREFMKSKTGKDLVIITNENEKLYDELESKLRFKSDPRIKFVGTVYDQELLMKIRENAFAYLHGHEVGGTNPSLLEALGSTKLNLLLDVVFNREAAQDAALYWTKEAGSLSGLIDRSESIDREASALKARERIKSAYSWEYISGRYAEIWTA